MGASRLPIQIEKLKVGKKLKFIRDVNDGHVWYRKGRVVYLIELDNSVAMIACTSALRDIDNRVAPEYTFRVHGFKYCRFVEPDLLIESCKELT